MTKLPRVLPVAPLLPWIKECCERETSDAFAARCGISPKRISDFTAERITRIQFNTLDRMISREGSRSIIDFYPDYDDPEAFAKYENMLEGGGTKERRGCDIEGCDQPHHSKGMCASHYGKHKRVKKSKTVVA